MPGMFPALRRGLESTLESKGISFSLGGRSNYGSRVASYGMPNLADGWDMDAVVAEYERLVWVFKSVEIIAGNASRLPFQITVGDEEEENHPLLRVMNKRANPLERGRAFRKRLSAQVLLNKQGAFVEVTRNNAGQVTRLDLLPPERVRVVPDPGGDYVDYFEYTRYDGEVKNLPPEAVRWVKNDHPLDPFSGVTPLEAAGVSIELDRLSRLYNVNFINRDGRPGGIVGVDTDGLPDSELDRIAALFKPGAQHAGNVTAIGVGKGGMNYIDTAAKPRDMAYSETAEVARKEILAAFGVPESIAGDASDRTFENASEEKFTFWHEVMLPHLELIASAFDGDIAPEADCGFDTSEVEVLEMPARRRREEARQEFNYGLRTIQEYRAMAPDLDDIDNPQTRALWASPAKAPIPGRPEDAAALGMADPGADPNAGGGGVPGGEGDPAGGGTAAEALQQAIAEGGIIDPDAADAGSDNPVGSAAAAVEEARAQSVTSEPLEGEAAAAVAEARMETKTLEPGFVIRPDATEGYEPGEDEMTRLELAVTASLEALLARQAAAVAERLQTRNARQGTPYWVPAGPDDARAGDTPIDVTRVMDTARWAGEAQEQLAPLVVPASNEAASGLLGAMAATGALVAASAVGADIAGRVAEAPAATAEQIASLAAAATGPAAMLAITTAITALNDWGDDRASDIEKLMIDQAGSPDLPLLVDQVKKLWTEKARGFAESVALTVAQTTIAHSRESAIERLAPRNVPEELGGRMVTIEPEVIRVWRTREDERVRLAHREAAGQRVGLGETFEVGGYDVRYPSDPLAPASVSRHCRCWLRYEWTEGAQFYLPEA